MTIIDEACYERGCACHDSREGSGIEVFAGDGGYGIGTREAYEEFVKLRNYPIPPKQEEQTNCDKQGEPDYKALWKQMCERCDELDAKLAKQEQGEPVAITITGKLGNIYSFTGDYSLKKGDKVYTTPQQRTTEPERQLPQAERAAWVGLTNEEKENCLFSKSGLVMDYEDVVDAVEARLKEKNT